MATQYRSWYMASLASLLFAGTFACGQDGSVDVAQVAPPTNQPQADPPPAPGAAAVPITGGTLLLLRDGKTAVAADPDRNVVWIVDVASLKQTARVDLQTGDEPGRLVEDGDGKVHVVLRRGGAVVAIDPAKGTVLSRRTACAAPRGIDYDPGTDRLQVVCAGGELVTFAADGGTPLRTLHIDSDLRDVIVQGDHLLISRFRSAELLTVDALGVIRGRIKPKSLRRNGPGSSEPAVAWRVSPLSSGRVVMLFERGTSGPVDTIQRGGYGSSNGNGQCRGIVEGAITILSPDGAEQPGPSLPFIAYAVDFAIARDGSEVVFVTPENNRAGGASINTIQMSDMTPQDPCSITSTPRHSPGDNPTIYEPTAAAYDNNNRLVVQYRNPPLIMVGQDWIYLKDAANVNNTGHERFHTPTQAGIACASCHPEAGDDGRVWNFSPSGPRRTQNLRGGLLATAPFHWDGDMTDMNKLMMTVFVERMNGPKLSEADVSAVSNWLNAQPAQPKALPANPQAVVRGKQLFEDATVGCITCHRGTHYTNNATVNVGTGGSFQVPSLVGVAMRAPYMHTGCASTLADRFDAKCGGDNHGKTSQLTGDQLSDIVSYMETL